MATVASFVADVVDNALTNVSVDACSAALTMFPGDKGAFSMTLDAPVQRVYSSVIVKFNDVIVQSDRYALYWLSASLLVIKTLENGQPFLPSKIEVAVDESIP